MNKIPIVSLFTGGGFLDMGFEMAGFDTVFTNEYDRFFAKLFEEGMNSWAISEGLDKKFEISSIESITSLSSKMIELKAFPDGKPELWGIIGGPPCQDFTSNGRLNGFDGVRGKMTIIFFNRIKQMLPSFFVMENVTGLLHNKESKMRLDKIIEKYCSNDYYLERFILNAIDYGVPQNRERVFLIGLRKNAFSPPIKEKIVNSLFNLDFKIPTPKYENARINFPWPKLNPFGETPVIPHDIPNELFVINCLIKSIDVEKNVSNINEFFPLRKDPEDKKMIQEGNTLRQSFKRLHRYRYSPTTCYGNNEVHLHPYENRRLSVREALRIQGVPDSYALSEDISMTKKFKMIGNGVPIQLAHAVAKSLMDFIKLYKIR